MARERVPGGISSVEMRVFVKDPDAASGSLFANYIAVPGVGGVTLPAEESPSTDEVMLEGVGQATGFSSPGTITVPLPRLTQHPAHRLLIGKHDGGGNIQVALYRAAVGVARVEGAADAAKAFSADLADASFAGGSRITSPVISKSVRPGHYVILEDASPGMVPAETIADAKGLAAEWQAVVSVASDFATIDVSPGYMPLVPAAADQGLIVRQPGLEYEDLLCTVGTMGRGEASGSASLSSSLVLRPDSGLGVSDVVVSTAGYGEAFA